MSLRCFNTVYFYCEARYLLLIQQGFMDKSNNPDLERCLPPPPGLAETQVTEDDEEAWHHFYCAHCAEEPLADSTIAATWGSRAAFESAAHRVEQIHLTYGYISLRHFRQDVWGTEELAVDGKPLLIAADGSGRSHEWEFDTVVSPPIHFIKYMSERMRNVPIRLVAYDYDCAEDSWTIIRYFKGKKLGERAFRRLIQGRGFG